MALYKVALTNVVTRMINVEAEDEFAAVDEAEAVVEDDLFEQEFETGWHASDGIGDVELVGDAA